jgi:hypothetical protein
MNTALPIPPLSRVVSGENPLKSSLHVGLLFFVWFLPMTAYMALICGYGNGSYWSALGHGLSSWLPMFAVLAAVLSVLVGRSASAYRTLAVHVLAVTVLYVWQRWH